MLKDLVQSVVTRVLMIPIGLAAGIVTARYLGPHDRGALALFLMLPVTARVFCMIGLDSASIYLHRKQKVPFGIVFANCVYFAAIVGSLGAYLLWLARSWLPGGLTDGTSVLLVISLATIPAEMLYHYLGPLARAVNKFTATNVRGVLHKVLNLVAVVLIVVVFQGGLLAFLLSYLLIQIVIIAWLCWDLRQDVRGTFRLDLGVLRRMIRFGGKSYATVIAMHAHYRVDVYLIAFYLNKPDIAFYAIAAGLAERILLVTDTMALVLFPRLTSVDEREAALLTARASRNVILLALLVVVPLCLWGRPVLILLYGPEYLPAIGPMYVLIGGVVMVAMARVLMQFLTSLNVHQHNAYVVGVCAVLNIALNVVLIPRYGIVGAAISSVCTYSVQGIWALCLFSRFSGLPMRSALLVSRGDLRYLRAIPMRMKLARVAPAPPQ